MKKWGWILVAFAPFLVAIGWTCIMYTALWVLPCSHDPGGQACRTQTFYGRFGLTLMAASALSLPLGITLLIAAHRKRRRLA